MNATAARESRYEHYDPSRPHRLRKLLNIAALSLCAVIPGAALVIPAPASANSCTAIANGAEFTSASPTYSRVWLTNVSGCSSGFPLVYNGTGCAYPPRTGEYWYTGPTRKGAGSISSNYSQVICNQYAHGVIIDVYAWWNLGSGWGDTHLYHY